MQRQRGPERDSLCRGLGKSTMRETEVQNGNSGEVECAGKVSSDRLAEGARQMISGRQFLVVAFTAVILSASAWAQGAGTDFSKIDITAEKIAPNLYMLSGSAGTDPGHQD